MNYTLPQKYVESGFKIAADEGKSFVLKYQHRIVFVFDSAVDVKDDFVSSLCESYLKFLNCGISLGLKI
jgi:hypothetical protein